MLQHFRGNLFTKSPKIIASSISKNVNEPVNYSTEGVTFYMQTCPLPSHMMYRQIIETSADRKLSDTHRITVHQLP